MINTTDTVPASTPGTQPLRGLVAVGTIQRIGKRADGQPWHCIDIREDGSLDLPVDTPIYACPDSSADPVAVIKALTEALAMARSYVEDEVSKRVLQFGPDKAPGLCALELQKLAQVDSALELSRSL